MLARPGIDSTLRRPAAGTPELGIAMAAGGAWLISLGGSWYYLVAGMGFLISGGLLLRRRDSAGIITLSCTMLLSLLWSLWEINGKGSMQSWGFDLARRTGMPLGIFLQ